MRAWWLVLVACGAKHPDAVSDPMSCDHMQSGSTCCESQGDCAGGFCTPPETTPSCGGACNQMQGNCVVDKDCGSGGGVMVCDPIPCSCFGGSLCVPACTDGSCDDGFACDPQMHRCAPKSCLHASECGTDFICNMTCQRRPCSSDAQCDGYCVTGTCFAKAGECQLPVP
jgi:hypothetical protein